MFHVKSQFHESVQQRSTVAVHHTQKCEGITPVVSLHGDIGLGKRVQKPPPSRGTADRGTWTPQ